MKHSEEDIYLKIRNTSTSAQRVYLFDVVGKYNAVNSIGNGTSVTRYEWDITASLATAIFRGFTWLTVIAAANPSGNYQLYTYENPGGVWANVDEVVVGLNTLGLGVFSNIGNIIMSSNDAFLISSINLGISDNATAETEANSDINGSLIYDSGYTNGLIGNFTRINLGNAFWINNPPGIIDGPFNRSAVTFPTAPSFKVGSYFVQIDSLVTKVVYVGISFVGSISDGGSNLYLNNALVWRVTTNAEEAAVAANVNAILGTAYPQVTIMESLFHIVPVTLQPGRNIFQVDFTGAIAMEIYDNTAVQIAAATGYGGLNVLFKGSDQVGQPVF